MWDLYHAHTLGCVPYTYTWRGVRHKQVCTRADSEGYKKKNSPSPYPSRGWNPGSSTLTSELPHKETRPHRKGLKSVPKNITKAEWRCHMKGYFSSILQARLESSDSSGIRACAVRNDNLSIQAYSLTHHPIFLYEIKSLCPYQSLILPWYNHRGWRLCVQE